MGLKIETMDDLTALRKLGCTKLVLGDHAEVQEIEFASTVVEVRVPAPPDELDEETRETIAREYLDRKTKAADSELFASA